ncbi:MAG: hypothetical protein P4L83_19400 [Nevskia sp.]|nr:hypothetical protein [Nevskia sp.]
MGRKADPKHIQDVVDRWRSLLLAAPRRGTGSATDGREADEGVLTQLLGLAAAELTRERRSRLKAAARALGVVLADLHSDGPSPSRPDRLDGWIRDYLVDPGPRLLISEERRRTELARQRDADRRQRHASWGLCSARIELPKFAWDVIEEVRSGLNARGGKVPIQAALVKIIEHYPSKSKRDRKPAGPKEAKSDLFG